MINNLDTKQGLLDFFKLFNEELLLQLSSCDVPKCGFKSWLEAFFTIEGKREEYLSIRSDISKVILGADAHFRLGNTKNARLKQALFDESMKVIGKLIFLCSKAISK